MRSPRSFKGSFGIPLFLVVLGLSAGVSACSSAEGSGDLSLVVEVLDDEITLENKTGTSLTKGEVTIIPAGGIPRPYVVNLPYMTSGAKRSFPFKTFRMSDGSVFRSDVTKGRTVKITATDATGKTYAREVPFSK